MTTKIAKTVFNKDPNLNHMVQPMFFGEELGIARYETQKHKVFDDLVTKQLSFFWTPEEVALGLDKQQFDKMEPHLKEVFKLNIQYQTLLDTVQGRAPSNVFGNIVSDVALENWITTWNFQETIHSRSYTHILRNLFADPSAVFDEIVENEDIMKRAESINKYYDDLDVAVFNVRVLKSMSLPTDSALYEAKTKLYRCMHSVNALEAIRFYVSFIFTFNFTENMNILEGNSKIMKLIARDEQLHLKGTQQIIRLWQAGKDDPDMAKIAIEQEKYVTDMFHEIAYEEIQWAKTLTNLGVVPGLTYSILVDYVKYVTATRMKNVQLECEFEVKTNPIKWLNRWLDSSDVQVAPQETEISSYLIGALDTEVNADELSMLEIA